MGSDQTFNDPHQNPYFLPVKPLNQTEDPRSFNQVLTNVNRLQQTSYTSENIKNIWIKEYPLGKYIIVYFINRRF